MSLMIGAGWAGLGWDELLAWGPCCFTSLYAFSRVPFAGKIRAVWVDSWRVIVVV